MVGREGKSKVKVRTGVRGHFKIGKLQILQER